LTSAGCVSSQTPYAREQTTAQRVRPLTPDEIIEVYARLVSFPVSPNEIRWFRAFAGYPFGVITCFNVMLHRRGKRIDPRWEDTVLSAPRMFERGLELLG
jgi:hypothetical protein